MLTREAAVMRGDVLLADPFPQMSCDPLRKTARVDEDERGVVLANQLGQSIVNLVPDFAGHYGRQRRLRQLDGNVEFSGVTAVDNRAVRVFSANEESRNFFDRSLRR